jgi:hypothetical protein
MEREEGKMKEFTNMEYDILNALYFVEPFEKILEEVDAGANVVADSLRQLIDLRYVSAMAWDNQRKEYVSSFIYDADNMGAYHYLATKEGLLAHHGRQ